MKFKIKFGVLLGTIILACGIGNKFVFADNPQNVAYDESKLQLKYDDTPYRLRKAIVNGNLHDVTYLIEHGTDVNEKDCYGDTALHLAADAGPDTNGIDVFLLNHGANTNIKDNFGRTPLHRYVTNIRGAGGIDHFVKHGANVNAKDNNGFTPLDYLQMEMANNYYFSSRHETIKSLIKHGAKHSKVYKLLCEIFLGNLEQVKNLVEVEHANLNAQYSYHYDTSPLYIAAESGHLEVIKYLIQHGAKITNPVIYAAIRHGHLNLIEYIFENHKNDLVTLNAAPLHQAAAYGRLEIVKYLVEKQKSSINEMDANGLTPLQHAIIGKKFEIAKYLQENGAKIL